MTFYVSILREVVEREFKANDGEGVDWKLASYDEAMSLLEDLTAKRLPELMKRISEPCLYTENGELLVQ